MYSPTLRQLRNSEVLGRVVAGLDISAASWASWCAELHGDGRVLPADLPLIAERCRLDRLIRSHRDGPMRVASIRKRPAGSVRKRTAFTLRRLGRLVPTRTVNAKQTAVKRRLRSKTSVV